METSSIKILGSHTDWLAALAPQAPVWGLVPSSVVVVNNVEDADIVIPLMEDDIAACTQRALIPNPYALAMLRDKYYFARYMERSGFATWCPETYTLNTARFPCMLKVTDGWSGTGIAVVQSPEQVQALVQQLPWLGHPWLLQELVEGPEYVMHMVCVEGRVLWHVIYAYAPGHRAPQTVTAPSFLDELTHVLRPLRFSGPCCANYIVSQGHLKLLEINPRFGASLMQPEHVHDLAAALETLLHHVGTD